MVVLEVLAEAGKALSNVVHDWHTVTVSYSTEIWLRDRSLQKLRWIVCSKLK